MIVWRRRTRVSTETENPSRTWLLLLYEALLPLNFYRNRNWNYVYSVFNLLLKFLHFEIKQLSNIQLSSSKQDKKKKSALLSYGI